MMHDLQQLVVMVVGVGAALWIASILEGLLTRRGWLPADWQQQNRIAILRYWSGLLRGVARLSSLGRLLGLPRPDASSRKDDSPPNSTP